MTLTELSSQVAAEFQKTYGRPPRWIVAAPGRVNVIGEHTDYNDGFVLPMAIERYTVMAADILGSPSSSSSKNISIFDAHFKETAMIDVSATMTKGQPKWSNYIRGVMAGFQQRGMKIPALDVAFLSTVPLGGGLSSSAALEVGTATLIEAVTDKKINPVEKALLCQKAEHEFAGVPCGIMDQFTSILGRENQALLLDCRSRKATPVPLTDPKVTVLIVNTHTRHKLADGEYANRRAQCEAAARMLKVTALRDATTESLEAARKRMSPVAFRRARHVITENERTLQMARALQDSDWSRAGQLMYASHESLRNDYEVSCPELDIVIELARRIPPEDGMLGCRMTGAGFGGCTVSLVRTEAVKPILRHIEEGYEKKTGNHATIFSSRPAAGAKVLN